MVSVFKQNHNTKKKGGGGAKSKSIASEEEEFQYVEKLAREELLAGVGKCVLIDPGCRNLLCCMHVESTAENKMVYQYTNNQNAIETKCRNFMKLRENLKSEYSSGNWLAGNVKYQDPSRGIGMRKMLTKEHFQLYLLDEFKTRVCPLLATAVNWKSVR
ncbi:hypothetical protein K7432_006899 [Basidiobolus ranarum]|uniref:Uncharacterized protein n=1 Tax=Basidiobolus ranarum TaxID=34480 RepID=A0ABR2W1T9_9FUNG